jgi:hypothetical protein
MLAISLDASGQNIVTKIPLGMGKSSNDMPASTAARSNEKDRGVARSSNRSRIVSPERLT